MVVFKDFEISSESSCGSNKVSKRSSSFGSAESLKEKPLTVSFICLSKKEETKKKFWNDGN
jgi:hypothetical protein